MLQFMVFSLCLDTLPATSNNIIIMKAIPDLTKTAANSPQSDKTNFV